jgi:GGDEF domain-containing protein
MKNDVASWEKLQHVLEWILAVKLRHPESLDFSLAYISFNDKAALGNRYGAMQAAEMLFELTHELTGALRKTDIVARNGTDFWVLLPHIEAESVIPKVSNIVEIAAANGLDIVDRDISIFVLKDNNILKQNGLDSPLRFLDYVKNNRSIARSWAVASN